MRANPDMPPPRPGRWLALLAALAAAWLVGCPSRPPGGLGVEAIARFVRPDAKAPEEWARAVHDALDLARQPRDPEHVCAVLAIVEQESGYAADPAVPGLGRMAAEELHAELADRLGALADRTEALVLDAGPEGGPTFRERLAGVRTERDLDLLFRDIVAFHAEAHPRLAAVTRFVMPRLAERLNPVRTAGPMQVSVRWAQEHPVSRGLDREQVRDLLYTVAGGVRYGTLRLFAHEADYDDPIYRFADYNAGFYASRNAAFQEALGRLTGRKLTLDGDLLAWRADGRPAGRDGETVAALLAWRAAAAPDLPESRLRRDLRREKERAFEDTELWSRLRADYAARFGEAPPYARVPDVALDSPKLKGGWTTRTFAERVRRRWTACLERGGATP